MVYMPPAAAVAASYQLQAVLAEVGPRLAAAANGLQPLLTTPVSTSAAAAHPPFDFSGKSVNNHVLASNNITNNNNNVSSTNELIKSGGDLSTAINESIGDENSKTNNSKIQRVRSSSHFTVDDLLYKCGERNKQREIKSLAKIP
uniref:Uncharacterized protein n=1 Tax=Romanomermis culicivorax TaxID=13658 RepID=A0A915L743_ROMCU